MLSIAISITGCSSGSTSPSAGQSPSGPSPSDPSPQTTPGTGQVEFRVVAQLAPRTTTSNPNSIAPPEAPTASSAPQTEPYPSVPPQVSQAFATFACDPGYQAPTDRPDSWVFACDSQNRYLLAPASIVDGVVSSKALIPKNSTGWAVDIQLDRPSTSKFADLSRALYTNGGQVAIVVNGKVISAAGASSVVMDGNVEVTGRFSEDQAKQLAQALQPANTP